MNAEPKFQVVADELTAPRIGALDVKPGKAGVEFRCVTGVLQIVCAG